MALGPSRIMGCIECGKEQKIPFNRQNTYKFCSRKCQWKWRMSNDEKIVSCQVCSSSFRVIACREKIAKYCSRKCYYKSSKGKGSIETTCRHCSKKFMDSPSVNRIYCSRECTHKAHKDAWIPVFSTVRKGMALRGLINICNRCGYNQIPSILGIHHRDRDRNNNSPENLEVLCPNCHSVEHGRHIAHSFIA